MLLWPALPSTSRVIQRSPAVTGQTWSRVVGRNGSGATAAVGSVTIAASATESGLDHRVDPEVVLADLFADDALEDEIALEPDAGALDRDRRHRRRDEGRLLVRSAPPMDASVRDRAR